jgi:hypothetical protein
VIKDYLRARGLRGPIATTAKRAGTSGKPGRHAVTSIEVTYTA